MGKQPGAQSLMAVIVLLRYSLLWALFSWYGESKSATQVVWENEKDSASRVLWSLWEEERLEWLQRCHVSTQLSRAPFFFLPKVCPAPCVWQTPACPCAHSICEPQRITKKLQKVLLWSFEDATMIPWKGKTFKEAVNVCKQTLQTFPVLLYHLSATQKEGSWKDKYTNMHMSTYLKICTYK